MAITILDVVDRQIELTKYLHGSEVSAELYTLLENRPGRRTGGHRRRPNPCPIRIHSLRSSGSFGLGEFDQLVQRGLHFRQFVAIGGPIAVA